MERFFGRTGQTTDDNSSTKPKEARVNAPNITWSHTWSFDESRDALSESFFANIPNEILLRIFQLFSVRDLCSISSVCRLFKMIADQDEIWKLKYDTSTKIYSKSCKQIYMDWMYEKSLRNIELRSIHRQYRTACIRCAQPSYPVRPSKEQKFESIAGFTKHLNSSADMTIELLVNIDTTARELIQLLEKASKFQEQWQQAPILKQMITRYYRFMRLKASHPTNILLIPTMDIEIVWQTHLLRPEMYQADCLRLFRRIIDHSLLITDIQKMLKDQAFQDTCQLYEKTYGEHYCTLSPDNDQQESASDMNRRSKPNYTYWDKTQCKFSTKSAKDYENPFSFTESDIILDMNWLDSCKQFMRNALEKISGEAYDLDECFDIDLGEGAMKRLKKSYERFLYMAAKYPLENSNGFVPPTYAIDIIWHSHMQEPLNYRADCIRLVGYVVNHAPWPMIEDNIMKKTSDRSDDMWKKEFQSDIETDHLYNTIDHDADWMD
ncbi:unnamed protein product [Adineta steineri]|uniref:F-box domain-containing protein n=1 Tax=Adineta steineri TaxID=433720 RepID=A0A814QHN3_9BILA|nr:unnamed protein product [Adineta steineri]CAF1119625.1 unnamed protein product [Adineta steineri]